MLNLVKSAMSIHMSTIRTVTSSITINQSSLNGAVLYQISLQSDLGLAVLLQCCWFSEMVSVFHILSDSITFPKGKSEALVDGNIAINKINHQMIYPLIFLGDIPHVFYEQRVHCPVNRSKLNFILLLCWWAPLPCLLIFVLLVCTLPCAK